MCIKFVKINNETGHYIKAAELPSIINVRNKHDHFKSLDGTNIFKFTTIHPVWDRFRPFWELIRQTKGTESTNLIRPSPEIQSPNQSPAKIKIVGAKLNWAIPVITIHENKLFNLLLVVEANKPKHDSAWVNKSVTRLASVVPPISLSSSLKIWSFSHSPSLWCLLNQPRHFFFCPPNNAQNSEK